MYVPSIEDFHNGTLYSRYRHHEGFRKRARLFTCFPEPILVVGCAYGYLVTELRSLGKTAYGIEIVERLVHSRDNEFIERADILNSEDVRHLLETHGVFGTIITEDVLPHFIDEEAVACANNCAQLGRIVVHLVTERGAHPQLNYRTVAECMTLTGQLTTTLEGM